MVSAITVEVESTWDLVEVGALQEIKQAVMVRIKRFFFISVKLSIVETLYATSLQILYFCRMTKENLQDLRDRVTSLRRHL